MGFTVLGRGLIFPRKPEVGFYRVSKRTDAPKITGGWALQSTGLARGLILQREPEVMGSTGLARGLILQREPEVGFYRVSKRTYTPKRTGGWVLQS